ncbi:MAG: acetamidase/formamidase family protein [Chloroflexota bacterium]
MFRGDVSEAAFGLRADRLLNSDELDLEALDWTRRARAEARAWLLGGVGVFGLLASVAGHLRLGAGGSGGSGSGAWSGGDGRVHTLPSTPETVRLGVFDTTLKDVLQIDSGDVVAYPDTWSHFLNRLQPGLDIDAIARLRREQPGRGPHSIIGPVGVRGAEPGDMLAIEFQRLVPVDWGATFVNPGDLGTGTLPDAFPSGQVRYLDLDVAGMQAQFLPGISVPLAPFQGTFAVAPVAAGDGVVSSVPPGQHAGNIDLRDLNEGSILYIPVWQTGAKLYTGDSHAAQGDGEINNQALESAMREVRVRVVLHKQAGWAWPFAETAEHWIAMGTDADLNAAFRIATRNAIDFLHRRAGLNRLDAYSLASIGVSFRVTQFVNQNRGVHALIPKALFSPERRRSISIV